MKICKKHWKNNGFYRFVGVRASRKRPKIDAETHSKKTSQKSIKKSIRGSNLAAENLPKSLQNRTGTPKMAASYEACFATLWKSPQSRRKLTGIATFGLRKWLCIWLGLLDLLLVARIIKVSSATCNAYNHWLSSQILPKYGKIHPKSRKIIPKSLPKSKMHSKRVPNAIFFDFGQFFEGPGPPKSSQNR